MMPLDVPSGPTVYLPVIAIILVILAIIVLAVVGVVKLVGSRRRSGGTPPSPGVNPR